MQMRMLTIMWLCLSSFHSSSAGSTGKFKTCSIKLSLRHSDIRIWKKGRTKRRSFVVKTGDGDWLFKRYSSRDWFFITMLIIYWQEEIIISSSNKNLQHSLVSSFLLFVLCNGNMTTLVKVRQFAELVRPS